MRTEPCACGLSLTAPADPDLWSPVVWRHNLLPQHRAWRARARQPVFDVPFAPLVDTPSIEPISERMVARMGLHITRRGL